MVLWTSTNRRYIIMRYELMWQQGWNRIVTGAGRSFFSSINCVLICFQDMIHMSANVNGTRLGIEYLPPFDA